MARGRNLQRSHTPDVLGPRVYPRGRFYWADLRPWGGGRVALRNPKAPGWPARGDRTTEVDIAEQWKWAYYNLLHDDRRRTQLGQGPRPRVLEDVVTEYLDARERAFEFHTWRNDRTVLETHFLVFAGKRTPTDAIDRALVTRYLEDLRRKGYAPSTVEKHLASIGHFFRSLGGVDPTAGVPFPVVPRDDVHTWSDEELEQLREAADRIDRTRHRPTARMASMRRALEFAVATGGRVAELFATEWAAVREPDRTVRFTRQILPVGHGTKALKGKIARTALVLPTWWAWHDARGTGRIMVGDGEPCSLGFAYDWINALYNEAGLNGAGRGWHTLRHTYARLFLESGGRLEELQKSLGHSSIVTTEKYYAHFHEDRAAAAARLRIYQDGGPKLVGGRRAG